MITIQELRNLGLKDLGIELTNARHDLYKIKTVVVNKKEKNTQKYEAAKKQVAVVLTVINELKKKERNEHKG
jgi:ribosomal protein L29